MRISLTVLFSLIFIWSGFCSAQSYYAPDSIMPESEKSFTLIYTKIHNTERLSELNAGFSSYLSSHKIPSRVRTLTVESSGESTYFSKLNRFRQILNTPFVKFATDVMVATDSEAHKLLLDSDTLVPGKIIKLSVVHEGSKILRSNGISTISARLYFRENAKLGLRLFPNTGNIIVLTDESPYGELENTIATEQLGRSIDNVPVQYMKVSKSKFNEFIERLTSYPDNTIIILSTWQLDNYGNYKFGNYSEPFLSRIDKFPILATQHLSVGSGVLGGYTVSAWDVGYKAAEFANSLDNSISRYDTIKDFRLVFDYNVMNRWDLVMKDMPKNSHFINRPDSLLENYRLEVNFIIALFSIMVLSLLVFTMYHIRHRQLAGENEKLALESLKRKILLDNTLSVMSEGVVSLDRDFNIIEINKKAREMALLSDSFIGKRFEDVFNLSQPAGKPSFENFLILALKSGIPQQLLPDFVLKGQNNEYRFISGEIFPVVEDESGKIRQLVFVFRDVTELYRLSRFIRTAMESAMFYTWYYNPAENLFRFEENFKVIAGSSFGSINTLEDFIQIVHPDDRDELINYHKDSETKNTSQEITSAIFRLKREGKYEWWQRRSIIQFNRDGETVQSYVYGMDININEYKEREEELIEAKSRAEESDKLKTAFLSNMSHEIRTPLNGIVGFSALLSDNSYSETEKSEFSDIINSNAKMLLALINDILDLSRIESNTIKFELREFSLNRQIEEVITLQQRYAKEGVQIVSDLGDEEITLVFDKLRNYQIINNLVSNSIKFTEKGEVRIGARSYPEYTEIYVSDTGKGMDGNQVEKVFSRFYKADEFSTGSGLGLAICKALIEYFGGTIRAESVPGKGTKVTYIIPRKNLTEDQKKEIHSTTRQNMDHNTFNSQKEQPGSVPTILIAEDLESNFILLKIILSRHYNILWAKNGIEAVSIFKEQKPDLVLMDIKMPLMDGLEATKAIREESPHVPIIAQTANAFESDHIQAIEAGCNDVITKPIKSKRLLEVVDMQINKTTADYERS